MRRAALAVLALCLPAGAALAQGPTRLEFSFSNPGARSMGFGGAFVALADDATAAFANPAGLVQLVRRARCRSSTACRRSIRAGASAVPSVRDRDSRWTS